MVVDLLAVFDLDYIEFLKILKFKYIKVYKTQILRILTGQPTL